MLLERARRLEVRTQLLMCLNFDRITLVQSDVTRLIAETDSLKEQLRDRDAAHAKRVSEVERDLALKVRLWLLAIWNVAGNE